MGKLVKIVRTCPKCKTTEPEAFSGRAKSYQAPCLICARNSDLDAKKAVIERQSMVAEYMRPCKPWVFKHVPVIPPHNP